MEHVSGGFGDGGGSNDQDQGQERDHGQGQERDHGQGQERDHGQGQERDHGQGQERDHGQGQERDQSQGQGRDHRQDQERDHGQGQEQDQSQGQKQGQEQDQSQGQGQDHEQAQGQGEDPVLRRLAERCWSLRKVTYPPGYWKSLYQQVFEYDRPLFHLAPCVFQFAESEVDDSDTRWKESFEQLQRGLHVRPGCPENQFAAHNIRIFETIHNALNYAVNSDSSAVLGHDALIFVHGGNHLGEIVIDFNVALLGASAGTVNKAVILNSDTDSTIKFDVGADEAFLGFLTLTFTPKTFPGIEEPTGFCLEITSSSPTVRECIIRNSSIERTAVRVSGEGARPVMEHCHICGSKSEGIIVENYAQGTYEHNTITSTLHKFTVFPTGILVKTRASPIVRENVVSGHKFGIKVSEEGYGVFEKNEIVKSKSAAIEVTKGGNPVFVDNTLEAGALATVLIYNGGFGVFLDNDVNPSHAYGIICSEYSNPTVNHNRIYNSTVGVHVTLKGRGWFQDNYIFDSIMGGIWITSSDPVILQNNIHDSNEGIHIEGGRGHIVQNNIYSNSSRGVQIETGSAPVLRRNIIHGGKIGVRFQDESCGELEDNVIYNHEYNVQIDSGSNPIIWKNEIRNGKKGGVSITDRSFGFLEENDIYENSIVGVFINKFSDPTLKGNKIIDNRGCGVSIVEKGKGKLEGNIIVRNSKCGLFVCSESNPTLRGNEISDRIETGTVASNDESETHKSDNVSCNKVNGVRHSAAVEPASMETIEEEKEEEEELVEETAVGEGPHTVSSKR